MPNTRQTTKGDGRLRELLGGMQELLQSLLGVHHVLYLHDLTPILQLADNGPNGVFRVWKKRGVVVVVVVVVVVEVVQYILQLKYFSNFNSIFVFRGCSAP